MSFNCMYGFAFQLSISIIMNVESGIWAKLATPPSPPFVPSSSLETYCNTYIKKMLNENDRIHSSLFWMNILMLMLMRIRVQLHLCIELYKIGITHSEAYHKQIFYCNDDIGGDNGDHCHPITDRRHSLMTLNNGIIY